MEEEKTDGNGKVEMKFKYFIKMGMNDDGTYFFESNVPNLIIGYGMLEFANKCVEGHILKLQQQQSKIIPAKGGIMNFARRRK